MSRSTSPKRSSGSPPLNDDINDRLEDLKKRFHLLEGDRKAYFETTQWTIQHNKERIAALRAENRDILANMTEIQNAVQAQMEGNNEADRMVWQIREIRKKHDEVKHKLDERLKYLEKLRDTMRALEMETPSPAEENSTLVLNMKNLENRIEKTSIRQNEDLRKLNIVYRRVEGTPQAKLDMGAIPHNKATTLRRNYEQILARLSEDRIGYDTRVDSLEAALQSKYRDLDEISSLYQDALHSKELARDELLKCEKLSQDEKRRRESTLDDKKQRIKQLMEANERMERRARREEARRNEFLTKARPPTPPSRALNHDAINKRAAVLEAVFKKLLATAGGSDASAIVGHTTKQHEMHRTLEAHQREGEARLEALRAEAAKQRAGVSQLRLAADNSPSARKLVDEHEAKLVHVQTNYLRTRHKYERAAKVGIALLAGVDHLASKLQFIEPHETFPVLTESTLPEVLALCEKKLAHARKVSQSDEEGTHATTEETSSNTPMPPAYTVRVRLPFTDKTTPLILEHTIEDDVIEDDDIITREQIKALSAALVERESKRRRKPVKKTPPTTGRTTRSAGASVGSSRDRALSLTSSR